MTTVSLLPVDTVDVTVLVDNAIDVLAAPSTVERRPGFVWDWSEREQLRSEHGYSLVVRIQHDGRSSTLLYDAGLGRDTAMHNMDVLAIEPKDVQAVDHVHAFVGGMHLTGGLFERIIPQTIQDLAALAPDYVVPGHCTGWRAQNAIVDTLPGAFLQSNVGSTFHFAAS